MKKLRFFILTVLLINGFTNLFSQKLSVEKIMQNPVWIGSQPTKINWSITAPNSIVFSWNPSYSANDSIFSHQISNKQTQAVSYATLDYTQAQQYGQWDNNFQNYVFAFQGNIYLFDALNKTTKTLTKIDDDESAPQFLKNNTTIGFSLNNNIYVLSQGTLEQLTHFKDGSAPTNKNTTSAQNEWLKNQQKIFEVLEKRHADKEFQDNIAKKSKPADTLLDIYLEGRRLQSKALNSSATYLIYNLFSAPQGNTRTIVPDYVTESGYTTDINSRTKVGSAFGKNQLFCLNIVQQSLDTLKFDSLPGIFAIPDFYKDYPTLYDKLTKKKTAKTWSVMGILWNEAGTIAAIDLRSNDNKDRWIVGYNPANKSWSLIDHQHDEAWIGGPGINGYGRPNLFWVTASTLCYQSEKTGYSHLYSYDLNAKQTKTLTSGNYEIQDLVWHPQKKYFYFVANQDAPGKQQIYRMRADGSEKTQLTNGVGLYEMYLSPNADYLAYRFSQRTKPPELFVLNLNEPTLAVYQITDKASSAEFKNYHWQEGKIITVPSRDAKEIYVRLYEPRGKKNNAAITFVHGAGYLQNVHYGWSSYFREFMFNNLLAEKGYTVVDIDYRASSGYGRDWRTGIYRFMGGKDLDDQEDVLNYLVKNYGINPQKLGMYGGSYGGFITLMALFTKPDLIKAGGALRSVTDWAHYNQGYTSNILNEPLNDSIAYFRSSPINFPQGLKNHLLMCHGLIDVNVHFQDIIRLNQRLIELGKNNWELAVYPLEDHGFIEPSSWTDEYKRILKLFEAQLK